jgi:predicted Zn-dependent protease
MTTTSHNRETLALVAVIEKAKAMFNYGIGESAESNSNTYATRDYSRQATKENTPLRYITRVSEPDNATAWLIANAHNGAMVRTLNGVKHYEIGHALGVWDKTTGTTHYPLMPKRGARRRGARGVSVERALSIYDND